MATKIKDAATAERAAMKLNEGIEVSVKQGEPSAPREKTTTERLFPDFTTDDGGIVNRPIKDKSVQPPVATLPAEATPSPKQQDQTQTQPPTTPVYLKPEELTGKMVKLKVDGVEQDVPAESLIKTNQLERHLNARLMELAQERKSIEDEKRRLSMQQTQIPEQPKNAKQTENSKKSPEVEALEARLQAMQNQFSTLQQSMLPAIQEAGIKRVEQMAKNRLGADDFRSYFDRIKSESMAELSKPENQNPQAQQFFDSDTFYFQKYQEMKIRDLMAKNNSPVASPNSTQPILQTTEGAPVVINNQGDPVSMPLIEPSGGVPSRMSPDASWQSTYNALFQRARETNSQEDWMALYRHKFRPQE